MLPSKGPSRNLKNPPEIHSQIQETLISSRSICIEPLQRNIKNFSPKPASNLSRFIAPQCPRWKKKPKRVFKEIQRNLHSQLYDLPWIPPHSPIGHTRSAECRKKCTRCTHLGLIVEAPSDSGSFVSWPYTSFVFPPCDQMAGPRW